MILGQAILLSISGKERLVLDWIPVLYGGLIQIGLNVGAQIERVTFLGPDGERRTAALKDIRRSASLKVGQRLFIKDFGSWIKGIKDADVGMGSLELFEHFFGHRREPIGPPILIDQLNLSVRPRRRPGLRHAASRERRASRRQAGAVEKFAPRKADE